MKARLVLRESGEVLKEGYGFDNQREDCLKSVAKYEDKVAKEHQLVETSTTWNREKFQKIIDEAIQERGEIVQNELATRIGFTPEDFQAQGTQGPCALSG